jgi:hypothetical protein
LPTASQGEGPPPTSLDIDGTNNFAGNVPIYHRAFFSVRVAAQSLTFFA